MVAGCKQWTSGCCCRKRSQFELERRKTTTMYSSRIRTHACQACTTHPYPCASATQSHHVVAEHLPSKPSTQQPIRTVSRLNNRHGKDHNTKSSIAKYPLMCLIIQRFPRVYSETGLCQEGGVRKPSCVSAYLLAKDNTCVGQRGTNLTWRTVLACQSALTIKSQHLRIPVDSVCWPIAAASTHFLVGGPASSSSASSVSLPETSN